MSNTITRREFVRRVCAGAAGLSVSPLLAAAPVAPFSFLLLGDLHFDRLEHHDLPALGRDKPDDLRQVRDYSRITVEILPKLFAALRDARAEAGRPSMAGPRFVVQVGDLVEGLCGSAQRARQQDMEVLDWLRQANLGLPFLFAKGNHDITGDGAVEAFKEVFHPFLSEQAGRLQADVKPAGARYALEHANALFCFFDAYDRESLPWLEAVLAGRSAAHCFVVLHPPVVPYGARSTWHLYSADREKSQRDRFLELLGRHNAVVLSGHIHKYSFLERRTARGGKFVQLALSSVIPALAVEPRNLLSGIADYNADQVKVEPAFSPATEAHRRAVYETEAPFVRQFQYADLPGYAVVTVDGAAVTARLFAGAGRRLWRTVDLAASL